jgi:hypothetical protein
MRSDESEMSSITLDEQPMCHRMLLVLHVIYHDELFRPTIHMHTIVNDTDEFEEYVLYTLFKGSIVSLFIILDWNLSSHTTHCMDTCLSASHQHH